MRPAKPKRPGSCSSLLNHVERAFYLPNREAGRRKRAPLAKLPPKSVQVSQHDRFPLLDAFVIANSGKEKKRFCDVGCSIPSHALSTFSTAQRFSRFGLQIEVHGVDIASMPEFEKFRKTALDAHGINFFIADYRKARLPENYDFIRLGNVTQYLDKPTFRRVLVNLVESLNNGGYLQVSSVNPSRRVVYKKEVRGNAATLNVVEDSQSLPLGSLARKYSAILEDARFFQRK